jgi:hypothetical protein
MNNKIVLICNKPGGITHVRITMSLSRCRLEYGTIGDDYTFNAVTSEVLTFEENPELRSLWDGRGAWDMNELYALITDCCPENEPEQLAKVREEIPALGQIYDFLTQRGYDVQITIDESNPEHQLIGFSVNGSEQDLAKLETAMKSMPALPGVTFINRGAHRE